MWEGIVKDTEGIVKDTISHDFMDFCFPDSLLTGFRDSGFQGFRVSGGQILEDQAIIEAGAGERREQAAIIKFWTVSGSQV